MGHRVCSAERRGPGTWKGRYQGRASHNVNTQGMGEGTLRDWRQKGWEALLRPGL